MKKIAKALDISYNNKHAIAFGEISDYKLIIKQDRQSNTYTLSFDITGDPVSQYKLIALRSTNRSIVDITTVGTHIEITITASANKSEDAENIKSIFHHLDSLLSDIKTRSCCAVCRVKSAKTFPYFADDKILYTCYNCAEKTKGKLISPNGENHLKGFLFTLFITVIFGTFIADFFLNGVDTADTVGISFMSAVAGFIIANVAVKSYRKFCITKRYRKSITYNRYGGSGPRYTKAPSAFGIALSVVISLTTCILATATIYDSKTNFVYLLASTNSFSPTSNLFDNILYSHFTFPTMLPSILIGNAIGLLFTIIRVRNIATPKYINDKHYRY